MNLIFRSPGSTLLALIFLFTVTSTFAQQVVQVSVGANYAQQAFYNLSDDSAVVAPHDSWDIAFTVYGLQDAGVFLNESAVSTFGQPASEPGLYLSSVSFDSLNSISQVTDTLWNSEANWAYGAFNEVKSPADPFDYGWGKYNFGTSSVQGNKAYVIKLRTGVYRKIEIISLVHPNYTFRHALLNGTDAHTITINKTAYPGKTLAYYSFADTVAKDLEPTNWDMWFGRFFSIVESQGQILNYSVTGVLTDRGVTVAQVNGVAPAQAVAPTQTDSFKTRLDVIGSDWKYYDFTNGWIITPDETFFVKTADQHLWKIVFIDFEGAGTGVITFEKTDLGIFTSIDPQQSGLKSFLLSPNRTNESTQIAFELAKASQVNASLIAIDGRTLRNETWSLGSGLHVQTWEGLDQLASGIYFVALEINGYRQIQKLIVTP